MNTWNNQQDSRSDSGVSFNSETVMATDQKVPVQRDATTVADDARDYVFIKPKRSRHHTESDENHSTIVASNLVRSTRSSLHQRRRKARKWKKALGITACVLFGMIVVIASTIGILLYKGSLELFDNEVNIITPEIVDADIQDDGKYIVYQGENYKFNERVTSLLFMGVDKRDMQGLQTSGLGGQSDVTVLMAIDFSKDKITMLAIPRDTMTDVAVYSVGNTYVGMKKMQLCLAYSYGDGKEKSCENVLDSVRRIFYNIPINSYFALDLDGISALNDAVGGVDVVAPVTIETFIEQKKYHLIGKQAERFVRARSHETYDANMQRMQRQEIYAKSFINTVIAQTKADIGTPVTLFHASAPYSCTNLNSSKITVLAREVVMGKGMRYDIETVKGSTSALDENHAQFSINEEAFFEQFLSVYYDKVDSIG